MARGIRSRIEGLEADLVGGRCPECGLPPDGPNYTVDRGEELPEDPDEECPRCGRRLWWVVEVEMRRSEERLRAFVADAKQRDRQLLEENRASVGLPPLSPGQLAEYGLEGTRWTEGGIPNG